RAAHGDRPRDHERDVLADVERDRNAGVLQPNRDQWAVLALRRHRMDFPVSTPVSHWKASPLSEHIVPTRTYYLIFGILALCTYLTWQVAVFDLGALNTIVALVIAVFKATLVVLFFMHVRYSTRLTWAVVVGGVFWLGILLALTMSDYLTRTWQTFG